MSETHSLRPATRAVSVGRPARFPGGPVNEPLSLSSTFHAGGRLIYARDGSPSTDAFEAALGALEGGTAISFSSGMAALAAVADGVPVGGRVVAPTSLYWGSLELLRHWESAGRFTVTTVETTDTAGFVAAAEGADLVWVETPSNPLIEIADVPAICAAARAAGAISCVDATMATPLLQRPLEQGADIVMHSVTKYLAGHSDVLMGALVTDPERAEVLADRRHRTGAMPGALEAYLALRGVRTLDVRLRRQVSNAGELAFRLTQHPAVRQVRYPGLVNDPGHELASRTMDGFGAMLSFDLADAVAADKVCAGVQLITDATSLGGVETLMERRAKYSGEQTMGTPEGLIRLSVGIEDVEDLWADLEQALDADR